MKILFCIVSFSLCLHAAANINIDELWKVWNDSEQDDTNRLKAIHDIAWDGYLFSQPDSAYFYADVLEQFAKRIGNQKFIGKAINIKGSSFYIQSNYEKALYYFIKGLTLQVEIGDKSSEAAFCSNIGLIYSIQQNFSEALLYFEKALFIFEALGDQSKIATSYNNLGAAYKDLVNYSKSLDYFRKALAISKKIQDKRSMALCLSNIGELQRINGQLKLAVDFFEQSLRIRKEIADKKGMANCYANIGHIYKIQTDYNKALHYLNQAFDIKLELGTLQGLDEVSENLYEIHAVRGNYDQALKMYVLHTKTKDSIFQQDLEKKLYRFKIDKEYQTKKRTDSITLYHERLIQAAEHKADQEKLKTEKRTKYSLIAIVLLILLSLVFVFKQLKKSKAQNIIIEDQHDKLNESHKEITDSINYAKRIQDALMTSADYMEKVMPNSFVFFSPKDVVSGDFYWVYKTNDNQLFFTVADCTGHGVPGAFMSMIGTSLLNENIVENGIHDPAKILDCMRDQIIKSLKQKGDIGENKDGMDMALCKYDINAKTIEFSGAHNPLVHIRNNNLNSLKADNQPVAFYQKDMMPFTTQTLQVQTGDMLYVFSDGFADQFGGEKGKKYMLGKFKKYLLSISKLPILEQKTALENEFKHWKLEFEQVDDVCVMGMRI